VPLPTKISLPGKFVAAAVGKSHSILVEEDGEVYAVGGNKFGQCGVNTKVEAILNWRKCAFQKSEDGDDIEIVQASCGENFTVLLSSEGYIYSSGLSEFGQLGNGETGEYFVTANKIAFANSTKFERRSKFVHSPAENGHSNLEGAKKSTQPLDDSDDIRIGSISCGKNHTVAVEAPAKNKTHPARVFTWGCGDYGVLGHAIQADEYSPRLVGTIQGPLFARNSPILAAAGAHCSMILTENGHVYYSGKHRSVGEATMRPALIDVLANNMHVVKCLGGGFQSVFCATANGVTVSWGMGQSGELGFGAKSAKSSSKPKFVEKLDKCLVTDVACGYGHTLFLIRDEDDEDRAAIKKITRIETSDLSTFVAKHTE
jgi:alpha-tubulin suppressor-like RCC1 family protein